MLLEVADFDGDDVVPHSLASLVPLFRFEKQFELKLWLMVVGVWVEDGCGGLVEESRFKKCLNEKGFSSRLALLLPVVVVLVVMVGGV
jgi:hypothetical protein